MLQIKTENSLIAPKKKFFGKAIVETFIYLLALLIVQNLKKVLQ